MTTNEKISALRAAAKDAGGSGVLLMTSDPHSSEYLPAHYNSLTWFSGFTGENSTLVVTMTGSALWCDGRFYVQADRQLAGTEIECMHAGSAGVPTVAEYLTAHFKEGQTLLLDGSCVPAAVAEQYAAALQKSGAALASRDVVNPLWERLGDRPALPDTPCRLLTPAQTGATAADRIALVRGELQKAGATALAVTGLDCVAWLTNLRANDLPCTRWPWPAPWSQWTGAPFPGARPPERSGHRHPGRQRRDGGGLHRPDRRRARPARRRGVPGGPQNHQL